MEECIDYCNNVAYDKYCDKCKKEICKQRILNDKSRPREQIDQWNKRIDQWFEDHPLPCKCLDKMIDFKQL